MKKFLSIAFVLAASSNAVVSAQNSEPFYYVVIGGFAKLDNATRYLAKAEKDETLISSVSEKYDPKYALNSARSINYVYILKTNDKKKAFALNIKLKAETEYKDSWVFIGDLDQSAPSEVEAVTKTPEPVQYEKKETVVNTPSAETPKTAEIVKVDSSLLKSEEPKSKEKVEALPGKPFIFKLADKASGKEVLGAAHVYESAKAREYQSFKGNEIAYVPEPSNTTNTYVVKIQAPGYKPTNKSIQFGAFDSLKLDQKETIVSFELTKVKSGDYIDFNEVGFIKNSQLMTPDSQNELDGLVELMKENAGYKIKIHGFCNGAGTREIISRGSSDKFFELDPAQNRTHNSSAKELSKERAEIVKAYLVNQGVEEKRLSIKAEGGDIPLYGEKSALASKNDRVEIEVKSN